MCAPTHLHLGYLTNKNTYTSLQKWCDYTKFLSLSKKSLLSFSKQQLSNISFHAKKTTTYLKEITAA